MEKIKVVGSTIESKEEFTQKCVDAVRTYMLARKKYSYPEEEPEWDNIDQINAKNGGEYLAEDYGLNHSQQDGLRLGSAFSENTKLWYRKNRQYPDGTFILDRNDITKNSPDYQEYLEFEKFVEKAFIEKGLPFRKEINHE